MKYHGFDSEDWSPWMEECEASHEQEKTCRYCGSDTGAAGEVMFAYPVGREPEAVAVTPAEHDHLLLTQVQR